MSRPARWRCSARAAFPRPSAESLGAPGPPTSVCTGSLLLAAAGLLTGRRATSHWLALDQLAVFGAHPTAERVVIDGPYVTAAGVSAGIDMALTLAGRIAGDTVAQAIQLGLEYAPEPPTTPADPTPHHPTS